MFLAYELALKSILSLLLHMQDASLALNKIQSELNLHKLDNQDLSTKLQKSFENCNHYRREKQIVKTSFVN